MKLRTLLAVSLCAVIGLGSPAFAASQTANKTTKTAVVKKKASGKEASAKNKGKLSEKDKAAIAAKAAADKKLAAAAKAKAEKDKLAAAKAKAEAAKKLAAKKAEDERKLAKAKADEARKLAKAKAEEERQVAKAKAAEEKRLAAKAKADAAAAAKLAKLRAAEERRLAVVRAQEEARQAELAQLASMEVAKSGNNGELRSEVQEPTQSGFFAIFAAKPKPKMLAETRALDAVLEQRDAKKKFRVKSDFEPQTVDFPGYESGSIVIDTSARYLYLIQSSSKARRYAIAVGREGLEFKGSAKVGDKQEWPRWIPTLDMQKRDPGKYGIYKDGMPGGPDNPLGARAIYLYQGKTDTHIRIHGTNQPQTIGTNSSNGCFRMVNEHVMDLYSRVKMGTNVIVM